MSYFYGLLILSFLSGLAEYLCPAGEESGVRRHLRLLCALLTLLALFRPLLALRNADLTQTLSDFWQSATGGSADTDRAAEAERQWETEVQRLDAALAAEEIEALLCNRYGVSETCFSVRVDANADGTCIGHLSVALSGRGIWLDAGEIQTWLAGTFTCTCTVYVETEQTEEQ